jgi:predicted lipid-binding transport protein (Tim44 family)
MSAQLIELLLFAGIAFVLINRLVSMLGTTDEDDPMRKNTIFGEGKGLKDVTEYQSASKKEMKTINATHIEDFIVEENKAAVISALENIQGIYSSFNLEKFIKGAKTVFKMIVKALKDQDSKALNELVDKRYLEQIPQTRERYLNLAETSTINAKVSEVLTFGNSLIIKVLFTVNNFKEEWTFQKSLLSESPDWFLTNTDSI